MLGLLSVLCAAAETALDGWLIAEVAATTVTAYASIKAASGNDDALVDLDE